MKIYQVTICAIVEYFVEVESETLLSSKQLYEKATKQIHPEHDVVHAAFDEKSFSYDCYPLPE
jgi:hypothetical protein